MVTRLPDPGTHVPVASPIGDALMRVSGSGVAEAALRYAEAGIPVLPCLPGGKRPITAHGLHDATIDPRQIARWWGRWPGANIGIPTGSVGGIDVVDIDVRPSGSGFTALHQARTAELVDGWAAVIRTPTGGLHLYYVTDRSRPQRCWQAASAHVDFRGVGGYVVAPPSSTARGDYTTIRTAHANHPIDAMALRNLIDPRPTLTTPVRAIGTAETSRIVGWLETRREGERNRSLFWAACRLAESGLGQPDIVAALAAPGTRIGLPEPEITATIQSAIHTTHLNSARPSVPQPAITTEHPLER
jgi:hypothetical protein